MTFSIMGFNNYYMGGIYSRPRCCGGYSPFGFSLLSNPLYNPFTMINTAKNLMNGNWPSAFGFNSPMNLGFNPIFGFNNNNNFSSYSNPYFLFNKLQTTSTYAKNNNNIGFIDNNPQFGFTFDKNICSTKNYDNYYAYKNKPVSKTYKTDAAKVQPGIKPRYTQFNKAHLNAEFLNKVKSVAKNINCDYEDLLAVMNSESGLNPQAWNSSKTAVGLIQFTNIALAQIKKVYGISLTKNDVAKMSAIEQLDLAEKFYTDAAKKFKGKKLSAADLYAITYVPSFAARDVLTRKGDGYYEGNEGLDENKDGIITKDDLNIHLAKKRVNLSTFA